MIYQNRKNHLLVKITNNNQSLFHLHKEIEFFFILDGEMQMTIGTQTRTLKKGMLSCAFPYTVHETKTSHSSKAIMLIVSPALLEDFHTEFNTLAPTNPFFEPSDFTHKLGQYMQQILTLQEAKEDIRLIKGYLYLLTGELLPALSPEPRVISTATLYEKITVYLTQHFKENLTLTNLADYLGYNKYYISHLFQDYFGCSFSDLLKRIRVEHAMGLLTHSELSITDICYESGFSSIRSFYRAFQEVYHQTPGNVRRISFPG